MMESNEFEKATEILHQKLSGRTVVELAMQSVR